MLFSIVVLMMIPGNLRALLSAAFTLAKLSATQQMQDKDSMALQLKLNGWNAFSKRTLNIQTTFRKICR